MEFDFRHKEKFFIDSKGNKRENVQCFTNSNY